jgi:hypothetical protein
MSLDLVRLMRLRLVVARYGEMDKAKWWNTKGVLARTGHVVFQRGFPRTAWFAQARVDFAVARSRCAEIFSPPDCMTLWALSAEIEDRFEEQWHRWLDQPGDWIPFFQQLQAPMPGDLLDWLEATELLTTSERESALRLRRSGEGRAVALPGMREPDDETVTLLAAGFRCGDVGSPAIPYARMETA